MKVKFVFFFLMAIAVIFSGCEGKKESEKKQAEKKGPTGYIINFKPNDSLELVPPKTIILQPSSAEGLNIFCLDVMAKGVDRVSGLSFDLNFDAAFIRYQNFKPGTLFESTGKAVYQVAPRPDQKGKLGVKISMEAGGEGPSGTGKVVTLCLQALEPGRIDFQMEGGEMLDRQKKKVAEAKWVGGLLWVLASG
jgi:hypothetical protein